MEVSFLEGSLVLEKLAEVGKVDDFMEAVDSNDVALARRLMRAAGLDAETIEAVITEMTEG